MAAAFQDQPTGDQRQEISFVKEAFNLQYNWIALAGAGAFALLSGSFLPIMLAGGVELMYLAIVPQNSRFQRLVKSWKFAEEQRHHQQQFTELLRSLPSELKSRYIRLAEVCGSIRANFAQLSTTSQIFLQQMDSRLEGLLRGYARLLTVANQQQQYLESTDPNQIKREIVGLQRTINDDPPQVQDINRKRIEILTKRLEKYQKLRDNGRVVDAQCSAVEDVLHLVRDQSVTMRDPQQVSDQLENLVRDVEQTEQTVQQVESIFSSVAPELDGLMSLNDTPSSAGGQRIRITS